LFGILKTRFRILRTPILFNKESSINSLFKTCCILHSILMDWDGMSDFGCEDDHWLAHDRADFYDILERLQRGKKEARGVNTTQSCPPSSATVRTVLQLAHSTIQEHHTHTHIHTRTRTHIQTNTHTHTHGQTRTYRQADTYRHGQTRTHK
jgi:hypothetical protein